MFAGTNTHRKVIETGRSLTLQKSILTCMENHFCKAHMHTQTHTDTHTHSASNSPQWVWDEIAQGPVVNTWTLLQIHTCTQTVVGLRQRATAVTHRAARCFIAMAMTQRAASVWPGPHRQFWAVRPVAKRLSLQKQGERRDCFGFLSSEQQSAFSQRTMCVPQIGRCIVCGAAVEGGSPLSLVERACLCEH